MKRISPLLYTLSCSISITMLSFSSYASTPIPSKNNFNLSGIHQNTMIQSCQEIPCSIAKIIKAETTKQTVDATVVQLTLLGGLKEHHQDVIWNDQPHTVSVNCSTQNPSIEMFNHRMPIYFVPDELVLPSDVTLYLKTCHNLSQSNSNDLKSLGYPLTTFIQP